MSDALQPPEPRPLAFRVAALQALLGGLSWLLLGYWSARTSLLLDPAQARALPAFFLRSLPFFGAALVVLLPAYRAYRLAEEAGLDVVHETEFLDRVFALPRRIAILDMGASILLFFLGALQLRFLHQAPALEAAKIELLGFLTGVLFGILSYFLLQPILRPLVVAAVERGSVPPARASFPLIHKIVVGCLAVTLIVTGLFGEIALSWAQRFAESRAQEQAQGRLRNLADEAETLRLQSPAGWNSYFQSHPPPPPFSLVFVQDAYGRLIAASPEKPAGVDGAILRSEPTRERLGKVTDGSIVWRLGEPRVISAVALRNGWRIVVLSSPDRETIRRLLWAIAAVAAELLIVAMLLAWAMGRGVTGPLGDLETRTREFARSPEIPAPDSSPTDDEIGVLSHSFTRMEDQIRSMQSRLRESERRAATAELLAGVAHEVRNPLFGITSTVAALEGELGAETRFRRHFEILRKEGERLSRMVREMLSLQRAPRRAGADVPLRPLFAAAAEWAKERFPSRTIECVVDCPDSAVLHDADEEGLHSVFTNLVENAVLASPDPVRIRLSARAEEGRVLVEVEDRGSGVDPGLRERLFEPFVSGRPGGTGMGLAVCRQIVGEHGGSIAVAPGASGGTVFQLVFPG